MWVLCTIECFLVNYSFKEDRNMKALLLIHRPKLEPLLISLKLVKCKNKNKKRERERKRGLQRNQMFDL